MAATSTTRRSCEAWVSLIAALAANKPRAVVSGGAGFIGSHLCTALLDRGVRVLALDNFITSSPHHPRHPPGQPHLQVCPAHLKPRGLLRGRRRLRPPF